MAVIPPDYIGRLAAPDIDYHGSPLRIGTSGGGANIFSGYADNTGGRYPDHPRRVNVGDTIQLYARRRVQGTAAWTSMGSVVCTARAQVGHTAGGIWVPHEPWGEPIPGMVVDTTYEIDYSLYSDFRIVSQQTIHISTSPSLVYSLRRPAVDRDGWAANRFAHSPETHPVPYLTEFGLDTPPVHPERWPAPYSRMRGVGGYDRFISNEVTERVDGNVWTTRADQLLVGSTRHGIVAGRDVIAQWADNAGFNNPVIIRMGRSLPPIQLANLPSSYKPVYSGGSFLTARYRPVYSGGTLLATGYRPVYSGGTPLVRYRPVYSGGQSLADTVRYRPIYSGGMSLFQYRPVYSGGTSIDAVIRYRPVYGGGRSLISRDGGGIIRAPDGRTFDVDRDLLYCSGRWGRSEAAFRSICLPAQMQMILDNTNGQYDPGIIEPFQEVSFTWRYKDKTYNIINAFITSVRPRTDHDTGLKTTFILAQGVLNLLGREHYELALGPTDGPVWTGEIIREVAEASRLPVDKINLGQVRISPAHYYADINPRQLRSAISAIRAFERAEVGYVNENRGDELVFEGRFKRELETTAPRWTFGTDHTKHITPEKTEDPEDSWENVFTAISVGAEKTTVLADDVVLTWPEDVAPAGAGLQVFPTIPVSIRVSLEDPNLRAKRYVASVADWTTAEMAEGSGDPTFVLSNKTRSAVTVTITVTQPTEIRQLNISGRGIAVYGALPIPEIPDEEAQKLYGRRPLYLPLSFVGDALNFEGRVEREAEDYVRATLARYARPQPHGRMPFDPALSDQAADLFGTGNASDHLTVAEGLTFPPGAYWLEGGDFQYSADNGTIYAGAFLSRRWLHRVVHAPQGGNAVGAQFSTFASTTGSEEGQTYLVAVEVRIAAENENDDPVLRIMEGAEVYKEWRESDLTTDARWLVALVRAPATGTVYFISGKSPAIISRWQMIQLIYSN